MRIFRKSWSLILGCFFPVSILKQNSALLQIFVLTLERKVSLLQQFTYMQLKVPITHFQKMIWFIDV